MSRRDVTLSLALALVLWLGLAGAAAAEQPAAPPVPPAADEEVFFESVDVNLVNVQVFVTDKKGNPVTGLGIDDFEIFEDRKPVKISNFFAVENRRPVAETAAAQVADRPLLETLELLPEEQRLHLVVYVDNFNIRPFNRNRVFSRLREFLNNRLAPGDRVMLVSYDRSLNIRHPFTNDPGLIASALFDLEKLSGHALAYDADRRDLMRDIEQAESLHEVSGRVIQFAQSRYSDLDFALDSMQEIVDSLAGIEGRKALLYVSDGLPMTPAKDMFMALQHKFNDTGVLSRMHDSDLTRRFIRLANRANTNDVTLYTIDAAGLRVGFSGTAEQARYDDTHGMYTILETTQIHNLQSSLIFLANQTGGSAIYNTNDVGDGLARIAGDFGTYYSLGYIPGHVGDGRYHKIEVKTRRKGLRVRHRSGYRDKPLPARMADSTMSTLRYGFARNPLGIALTLGEQISHERGNYLVDLVVRIPIGRVTLVPQRDFHEARVKLFVAAMDEDGGIAPVQEESVPIRIPLDELERARQHDYHYAMKLLMRSGGHRIAIGVRDEIGAESSFIAENIRVGAG